MLKYFAAPCVLLLLVGCATAPTMRATRDPLERVNRKVYSFNTAIDRAVIKPVAVAYRNHTPRKLQHGIGNFFDNLSYPVTIVNDVLQGKLADGGRDTVRLVFNTVFGLGFFDPASRAGLEAHNEDFSQTLAKWGVRSGPFLMLPLLGPSTVRDSLALVPDDYLNGRHYLSNSTERYGALVVNAVDARAQLLDNDSLIHDAYDPYTFVRNAWLQRREYLITDGASAIEEENDDQYVEPAPAPDAAPAVAPDTAPAPAADSDDSKSQ